MSTCDEYRVADGSGLIAILRARCKESDQSRLLKEGWLAVVTKYAEPEYVPPQPTTLWRKIGLATGYNYRDIAWFARAEGFDRSPDALLPIQKVWLRNSILCNWAVREGHFQSWAEADQIFCKFWGSVGEKELIDAWIAFCKESEGIA